MPKRNKQTKNQRPPVYKNKVLGFQVSSRLRPKKYSSTSISASLLTSYGGVTITTIPQGTETNERTGDIVSITGLALRLSFIVGDLTNLVRFIITRTTGFPLTTINQVLEAGYTGSYDITSHRKPLTEHLFEVIMDETYTLVQGGSNATRFFEKFFSINKLTSWLPTTTQEQEGCIQIWYFSDSLISPNPTMNFTIQTWFKEY